jgi:prevent-host-death family protein
VSESLPTTQTIEATVAAQELGRLLDRVSRGEARVIVEQSGTPLAAIISTRDLERLDRLEAERQRDFAILDEIGELFSDVSPDELDREVAAAISEVRAESTRGRSDERP